MIVVLTGAGVSAESGLSTFRDTDGIWTKYSMEDMCTPRGYARHREEAIGFYNLLRKQTLEARPNAAHTAIAELEKHFDVKVITQNVDNLHERAGSTDVLHLHGEICKLRSEADPNNIVPIEGWEQNPQDRANDGALLRPHIVFFEESVPNIVPAVEITEQADVLIIVGTSFNVYPAAQLIAYAKPNAQIYVVDPAEVMTQAAVYTPKQIIDRVVHIQKKATEGVPALVAELIKQKS